MIKIINAFTITATHYNVYHLTIYKNDYLNTHLQTEQKQFEKRKKKTQASGNPPA